MKWAAIVLVILGVLAALAASVLVNAVRTESRTKLGGKGMVQAVVATRAIPAMSKVSSGDIEVRDVPKKGLDFDYFSDPVQVIGKVVSEQIDKGKTLNQSDLVIKGSARDFAARIPEGMRAVSVAISKHSIAGGLIYPESFVDVIVTYRSREYGNQTLSETPLRGIKVLAVDDKSIVSKDDDEKNEKTKVRRSDTTLTVTLLVDPKQAEILQAAMNSGKITLAMRNPGEMERYAEMAGAADIAAERIISADPNDPNQPMLQASESPVLVQKRPEAGYSYEGYPDRTKKKTWWEVEVIKGQKKEQESLELEKQGSPSPLLAK